MSLVTAAADFRMAEMDYRAIAPILAIFAGAMLGVLIEAFAPRRARYYCQLVMAVVALLAAAGLLWFWGEDHQGATMDRALVLDAPAHLLQMILLALSLLGLLVMGERFSGPEADAFTQSGASAPGSPEEAEAVRMGGTTTEVFPLFLFAVAGMMIFVASGSLLTMFVALEVLSLPLYILSGLARRRRLLSQEAALKYFLLGAFSSAFFLFGAALIYGATASMDLGEISNQVHTAGGMDGLLIPGLLLVVVGILFKVGAVPFHSWTPDVYQGAPTPVTGFMAACTKLAAFGALLRLLYVGFEGMELHWRPILAVIAVLTMLVGSVLTVVQTDVKRLLAYSSIAHAGFVLVGVLALSAAGISGTIFYLAAYGFMTIPAFALIMLVRHRGTEATDLAQWAGVGRKSPTLGIVFTFLLLAFTGIPLTSGFSAKFAAFSAIIGAGKGWAWLAVLGIICSAITAYAYFKVVVRMFFDEPDEDTTVAAPSILTTFAVTLGVLVTLALGVFPGPLLDLAAESTKFIP